MQSSNAFIIITMTDHSKMLTKLGDKNIGTVKKKNTTIIIGEIDLKCRHYFTALVN